MNRRPDESSPGDTVERDAAAWVLRERAGLSWRERRALARWLREPTHATAFAELQQTSRLLDRLGETAVAGGRRQTRAYWLGAALAAAAAIALVVRTLAPPAPPVATESTWAKADVTDVGEFKRVALPDGSVVGLNTNSAIAVRYSAAERRVTLARGEAFFTVAKNPDRPFWVEAGNISVRAVGTAFNVRFRPEGIEVLVEEGKVQVGHANVPQPESYLVAGEKALVKFTADEAKPVVPDVVSSAQVQSALAWQRHRLEFVDAPLADVVAEFNRYNRHQLVITDPALAAQRFGGVFSPVGSQSFVEILQQSFGVVAEERGDVTILRQRR